jgi:hypothetical protein
VRAQSLFLKWGYDPHDVFADEGDYILLISLERDYPMADYVSLTEYHLPDCYSLPEIRPQAMLQLGEISFTERSAQAEPRAPIISPLNEGKSSADVLPDGIASLMDGASLPAQDLSSGTVALTGRASKISFLRQAARQALPYIEESCFKMLEDAPAFAYESLRCSGVTTRFRPFDQGGRNCESQELMRHSARRRIPLPDIVVGQT